MDLFSHLNNPTDNLLPYDGEVNYYGSIIEPATANRYFHILMNSIAWKKDQAVLFGKRIETKREVAWYGDFPFSYTYSNSTKTALNWTKELLELKSLVEFHTKEKFNSCLLNLYFD